MSDDKKNIDNLNDIDELLDDDLVDGEGVTSLSSLKKRKFEINRMNKIFIGVLIFFLIIFGLIYSVFYYFKLTLDNSRTEFGNMYLKYANQYIISNLTNLNLGGTNNFDSHNKNTFKRAQNMYNYVINPNIIFYQKKDEKRKFVNSSFNKLRTTLNSIKNVKEDIVKYRYINKELKSIVKNTKIMPILITLNAIKLYFTDYVFIKLGTFETNILDLSIKNKIDSNSTLLNFLSYNPQLFKKYVKEDLLKFASQGVKIYLKDIVFNYMYSNNVNGGINLGGTVFVNDFEKYFQKELDYRYSILVKNGYNGTKLNFEKDYINLFEGIYANTKKFLNTADTNFLPINIQLLNYDAQKQTLSFSIKIILGKDIQSNGNISVIGLATDIITLLRESRLIIGKSIKADNFKVSKIITRVAGQKLEQNTITLNFSTSVQSNVNVEVTDSNR